MLQRKKYTIIISSVITVIWVLFIAFGTLDWFDLKVLDFFITHAPPLAQDTNIVVVEYDDKTAENLATPATKLDLAVLVHIIEQYKPRVLALDIFSLYGLLSREDSTMLFEEVLSQYINICYGIGFIVPREMEKNNRTHSQSDEFKYLHKFLYPLDSFKYQQNLYHTELLFKPTYQYYEKSNSIGHLVLKNDVDGMFRRIPALIKCGDGGLATLGIQAAFDYYGLAKEYIVIDNKKIVSKGTKPFSIPLDKKAQMMIRYNDKRDKIREISMIDILGAYKNPESQKLDLQLFNDKLVFIGNTSSRTARFCATPFYSYYPTILLHANVANNVLQRSFLTQTSKYILILLLVLSGLVYTLSMLFSKDAFKASVLLIVSIPILPLLGYLLIIKGTVYVPLFTLTSYVTFLLSCLIIYRYLNYKNYLLIALKQLQEAMRLKERLATIGEVSSKVAHEIRNPLNAIELYTSLLKRHMDDKEEGAEHLDIIREETQRLNRFITRLLSYARPKELVKKPLNVKSEIDCVIQLIAPDADKKNVQIICTVPDGMTVMGDPDQVHEIFLNLIKNSIEAMSSGGKLEIYSEIQQHFISLFFKDTGKGIPREDIEKIFNPFFSTKEQGTGLGLAMVKKIVEAHHGEIQVQSEAGIGTCIEIKLPLKQGSREKGTAHGKD